MKKLNLLLVLFVAGLLQSTVALAQFDFISKIVSVPDEHQYALVVALPDGDLTAEQQAVVDRASKALNETMPSVLSGFGSSLFENDGMKKVFLNSSNKLRDQMVNAIDEIAGDLPKDPLFVSIYFLPIANWRLSGATTGGQVPQISDPLNNLVGSIQSGIFELQKVNEPTADKKFYFIGAAATLRLEKDNAAVNLQFYTGLQPGAPKLEVDNSEVHITNLRIPDGAPGTRGTRPTALVSIRQRLVKDKATDAYPVADMTLSFGSYGGLSGGRGGYRGVIQVDHRPAVRDGNRNVTHYPMIALEGTLKEGAHALFGSILDGREASFRIMAIDVDISENKVDSMKVCTKLNLFKVLDFECLTMEEINKKFAGEANEAIQNVVGSLYSQNDVTEDLLDYMYEL